MERIIRIDDDEIDSSTVGKLQFRLSELLGEDPTLPIKLIINSYGGHAYAMLMIIELVQSSTAPIVGMFEERAFSAAFNILQFCTKRLARPHSFLCFHVPRANAMAEIMAGIPEGTLLDGPDFDIVVEQLSRKSGKGGKWLREFALQDKQLTANEALELGFIDEVEMVS